MDDAYRVSTRYFRIIVVCVWIVQGHTTYCTSFVSYTILRSNLRFSPCRSLDQFLHYEVVMVLLTAFERFLLPVLSRQLNHYSAPFWTRQALFPSFLRFLACHALARSLVIYLDNKFFHYRVCTIACQPLVSESFFSSLFFQLVYSTF